MIERADIQKKWWKESVVYQIYPRSFCDSNGDGIGDLPGITSKLDYLQQLGVDVIWLSPVYQSPNDDNGYDICDYRGIMEAFGTLGDWEALLQEMHRRGMRLIMDLVVNHTSDEHPWFVEGRKSKDNLYRDYYIWREGKEGREPNKWRSYFSGSAWQYDEATGEYYLHLFSRKQPDLNWENPNVRAEVYDLMRWWLEKGIDGFRMDVINMISKAPELPDAPAVSDDRYQSGTPYFINGPRLMEFLTEMQEQVLSKYDILTVGETPGVTPAETKRIASQENGPLSMVFQFEHMDLDAEQGGDASRRSFKPWRLADLKRVMTRWQVELEGQAWNSQYFTNHDQPRAVSRFGNDTEYRVESAKLLATLLLTLQGIPYIYQGEEIGMTNVAFDSIEDYNDIETVNMYWELVRDKGQDPQKVLRLVHAKSRDNARTPMQWDASPQAGFTQGKPWMKINTNYREINALQALSDPNSIFYYYQKLIRLRRENPVLVYGEYDLILEDHPQIYAYSRSLEDNRLLVMLNFSKESATFELPAGIGVSGGELLAGNYPVDPADDLRQLSLRPYEARVYRLKR